MLNEWIEIHPILKKLDCDLGKSDPNFKRCPKKKGYRIFLDTDGHVEDVDIPDFCMESVYRWQVGKKDPAFPVFNCRTFYEVTCDPSLIPPWIIKVLKEKDVKKAKKVLSTTSSKESIDEFKLHTFLNGCNDLWQEDLPWIERCLKELPQKLQCVLETSDEKPGGYKAYEELVRRAEQCCGADEFRAEVRTILLQKLQETRKKEYAEVLFALKKEEKKKGRGKEHKRDFLFLLTIKDWDNPEYGANRCPPYHNSLQAWMAQAFEKNANEVFSPTGIRDAFGLDTAGAENDYDDVNAAGLGQIKLFSANEDIPCLVRYGRTGAKMFLAGRIARENARKTLEYILHREREGITWKSLRKYEIRNTVAFAYCTELKDANVIQVFDSDETEGKENIYISEAATTTALKTLDGITESAPDAEIVVGIIAAVDKGNTKILASRRYPIGRYLSGARDWQKGCVNIPKVVLPWFLVKNRKSIKDALPIYPARAIWLLNSAWRQNGEMIMRKQGNQKVPISKRFGSSDALDFLFEENEVILERIDIGLSVIIEKSVHALIAARLKAILDRHQPGNKLKFHNDYSLHMLPTLYGLLLHKKGIKKEGYMKETIFNLGRLFAVADRLHILYSQGVRQGDIPLRLIGNDYISLALQNPQEAFVTLGKRLMHPYISWAKRNHDTTTDFGKEVGWCLWDITKHSQLLADKAFPEEIGDADRAKLILGYLSYGAKSKDSGNDNPENNEKTNEEAL
jgi:hypothetical protein